METIGDRLKQARLSAGYETHRSLAHRVNMGEATISRYERDKMKPSVPALIILSEALGADLGWLATGKGSMGEAA